MAMELIWSGPSLFHDPGRLYVDAYAPDGSWYGRAYDAALWNKTDEENHQYPRLWAASIGATTPVDPVWRWA